MNNYRARVGASRLQVILYVLILAYVGDLLAGWPLEWYWPIWGVFALDTLFYFLGAAWGLGSGKSQLAAAEEYGEFASDNTVADPPPTVRDPLA